MKYTIAYVGAILGVNVLFAAWPQHAAWWSLVVGAIFVLRDFSQREIGHWVWAAMLAGAGLSYAMASPFVAFASLTAFLLAEAVDWAVYSFTRLPLAKRVLLSSLASTPIDSAVFLLVIGAFSWSYVGLMVCSKMIAALVTAWMVRRHAG